MHWQEAKETTIMALGAIRTNKLRSSLTILGIVVGITTVIVISSIISGLNSRVTERIESFGSNLIYVFHFNWATLGRIPPEVMNRKRLTYEDAEAIRRQCPSVKAVSPIIRIFMPEFGGGSLDVRSGSERAKNVIVQGIGENWAAVFELSVRDGRVLTEMDLERHAMVCLLGFDTAQTLFPKSDPIGKYVLLSGHQFTVVGVMEKQKETLTGGANPEDNLINLPIGAFRKLYPDHKDFLLVAKAATQLQMSQAIDEMREVLRRRRRVPVGKPDNFAVFTQDTFVDFWHKISGSIFVAMFIISSVGLVVGGVGVMNIMLVTVTERTREIGIRKAIGARRHDILLQFLLEAMTLTGVGGLLGVALGLAIDLFINIVFPRLPAILSPFWVLAGLLMSIGVGLGFGIYPAYRAARLSPIEALRYE
ncbi:MAG: ABC transporter permease [Acidobacteria bacterium]|nr:ABC transporter permease [Acidobacteriota bacterium]MBI3654902.1 ABC transporter permease [Acidobacteriota bacterium]